MINHLLDYFKILLFAFEAVHGIAATYIQNLGAYNLRSSLFRTKVTLGDRSFQMAAPIVVEHSTAQALRYS